MGPREKSVPEVHGKAPIEPDVRGQGNLLWIHSHPDYKECEDDLRGELRARAVRSDSVASDPTILTVTTAQLSAFAEWLELKHGPILVTIETWSDGTVAARWPEGRLYGEGSCDADAMRELAENIQDCAERIGRIRATHRLAGAALEQWRAIQAMFVVRADEPKS